MLPILLPPVITIVITSSISTATPMSQEALNGDSTHLETAPIAHHHLSFLPAHPLAPGLKFAGDRPELGERLFLKVPTTRPRHEPPLHPAFAIPDAPFWDIDDIPLLMDRFLSTAFDRIPPHVLRRIQIFCRRYPAHIQCRKKEWKKLAPPPPPPPTTIHEHDNISVPNHFPPVPKIPQNDTLADVPKSLIAETPHSAFQELKNEDRTALLESCSGKVKCLEQDEASTKKREQIAGYETALAKKISGAHSTTSPEDAVQLRLMRTQQVKNALFQFVGIADQVVPADDGTFQNDILLTVQQSNYLINAISGHPRTQRNRRQSLFLDALPNEKWDVSKPIKYVFDSSLEENDKEVVKAALDNIASQTCIKFELANDEEQQQPSTMPPHLFYVKVPESDLCGLSYIGRAETINPIYLSFACDEAVGIAIHETLHALGVNHEQLRSDRDDYVTVIWDNINPKQYDYFAVADANLFTR